MAIFLLAVSLIVSKDYYPKRPHVWVEITKPEPACLSFDDAYAAQSKVLRLLRSTMYDFMSGMTKVPPKGCYLLKVGDKLELDIDQPHDEIHFTDYCMPGCSPSAWSVFGPSEQVVGEYTKPAAMPSRLRLLLQ